MTLAKRVIPVMLVKGQTLVKGTKFNPWRSIGHAAQAARVHARRGVDELCILDVAATAEGRGPDLELVKQLSEDCYVPITVGGGVKTLHDIDALLRAGADKVAIGAAWFRSPRLVRSASSKFGSQAITVVLDVGRFGDVEVSGEKIAGPVPSAGFKRLSVEDWARLIVEDDGAGEILLQCVERDGMMQGYDLDLIRSVTAAVDVPVIASCGAGTYEHLHEALQAGADAVAAGAMWCFTDQTPKGAAQYLKAKGWEMRC